MSMKLKRLAAVIMGIVLILGGSFYFYTKDYYHTDEEVQTVFSQIAEEHSSTIVLTPDTNSTQGIIFYPGAKVEESAYLPLLEGFKEEGFLCVVAKMPFHLAFFNMNAADEIMREYSTIKEWTLMGHSLGGAMASAYAAKHPQSIHALILLGAYVYGDVDLSKTLLIYGSEDHVLNKEKISSADEQVVIEGGNHAQFGNYGQQEGDGEASISAQDQQAQTVRAVLSFLNELAQ